MDQQEHLLRIAIGGHLFAVPMGRISSLLRSESIQYSPAKTGPFGWSLSPTEVEIWQIHRAFGLEPAADPETPAIQIKGEPARALLVDSLHGTVVVEKENLHAPLAFSRSTLPSPLLAIALHEGQPLPILDLDVITGSPAAPSSPAGSPLAGSPLTGSSLTASTVASSPVAPPVRAVTEERSEPPGDELPSPAAAPAESPSGSSPDGSDLPPEATSRALLVPVTREAGLVLTLAQIRAVSAAIRPVPLPASPPFLQGISSLDDEIVYHVDWTQLLGLPQAPAPRGPARTVIASDGLGRLIAFQSSSEMAVLEAEASLELVELEKLPFPTLAPTAAYFQGRLAFFPDLDALAEIRSPSHGP